MRTVWKFPLKRVTDQTIAMPKYVKIRSAGLDPAGEFCVWAEVNTDDPDEFDDSRFFIIGTGKPLPALPIDFLSSVREGDFVWHIYFHNPPF